MNDDEKLIEKTDHVISLINGKAEHGILEKRDFNEDFIDVMKTMDEIVILHENDNIKKEYERMRGFILHVSQFAYQNLEKTHLISREHVETCVWSNIRIWLMHVHDMAFKINQECVEIKHQEIIDAIQKNLE